MNKNVRNLNVEQILFFDIETVRRNRVLDIDSREYNLYSYSLRDKTTGIEPPFEEVITHYNKNAALKPEFNKIVVISVGFIKDTVLYYKSVIGTQSEILTEFYNLVSTTGFSVCGHNIKMFDIPVCRIKAFEEGLDLSIIPDRIMDSQKKPWDLDKGIIDTMDIIKGTYYYSMSLDSACMLANIESSKDDISGSEVSEVFYKEGITRLATYCNKDVIATAKLFCSLQGNSNYITKLVDKGVDDLKKNEPVNLLDHIVASGELSNRVLEGIKNYASKSNRPKEEILTIVVAALSAKNKQVDEQDRDSLRDILGLESFADHKKAVKLKAEQEKEIIRKESIKKHHEKYPMIACVVDKQSLGKLECKQLINRYKDDSEEMKQIVFNSCEKLMKELNKSTQIRVKSSLDFLRKELLG